MAELKDRLQEALGAGYRVERELGGGGMSRVFLADELRLGRRVVVKVLPPEMAAGVSVARFEREIQLAARLQHPHIVPLLTAGSADDLLYYIMPYIEGESLRAKLAREGELPVPEALRILRDVLEALSYAHGQGVVHRDIKPDNVLLSGKHALVTDFGVAKAVAESTGKTVLTSLGVALGTPAYMAPEQAVADPHVDHRADIYAVGILAYEMLSGRLPFAATSPQAMLAAHVTEVPDPVTRHRAAVPESLNQVVLHCLEKKPADRWQRVDEVLAQVEAALTPTAGITPTGTQPVISSGTAAALARAHPVRVAGLFGLASVGVLALVYVLVHALGLPDWVFDGAIGLLVVGLPIMLLTGRHERRRALARSTGHMTVTPGRGLQRHLTWRKALVAGALAFAGLGMVSAAYMAMRAWGIGPVGTLMASGALKERSRLVVADFANRTADSGLGRSLTEALRVDLSQSRVVRLLDAGAVAQTLARMNRPPETPIDAQVAREVAERDGAAAVVEGDIGSLGKGYVLTARLVSAADGSELVALRETAVDDGGIIGAVDRLSKGLRERIGESLKTIRQSEPLEQVTTSSLEALRRYTEGVRAFDHNDYDTAIPALEQAIATDSTFAMAYRKLAAALTNTNAPTSRVLELSRKAFEYRLRLPPKERYQAEAWYYIVVEPDMDKVVAAYQSVLDLDPTDATAATNLAVGYMSMRRNGEAEALLRRVEERNTQTYTQLASAQIAQGEFAAAESTSAELGRQVPGAVAARLQIQGSVAATRADYIAARVAWDSAARLARDPEDQLIAYGSLGDVALVRGAVAEAERQVGRALAVRSVTNPVVRLNGALGLAEIDLVLRQDPKAALATLATALASDPLAKMEPVDRPYTSLASFYADVGRVDLARQMMAEYARTVDASLRRLDPPGDEARGAIALAEGRKDEAITALQRYRSDPGTYTQAPLIRLALAYDRFGMADSALAYYEQFVETPFPGEVFFGLGVRAVFLGPALKRLGELYEANGDRAKALEYYGKLVDLWKDADPELQPVVRDVKQRMAKLAGEPKP